MDLTGFIEALQWRYATKKFDPTKKVPESTVALLLEATRLAPSSFGLQPWKFLVVTNQSVRSELKSHSWNQPQVTDCSHLIVLCTRIVVDRAYIERFVGELARERGVPVEKLAGYQQMMIDSLPMMTGERGAAWKTAQTYIALGTLLSACAVARIDACPMEGFDRSKYDSLLKLPEQGLQSCVVCPIGYRAADDSYATAKKVRFATNEVVASLG